MAVHSLRCSNVQNLMYEVERRIPVEWARAAKDTFPVKIAVRTEDRPGMLNQLTQVLLTEQTNIRGLEARGEHIEDDALVEMTLEVRDMKQLERVVSSMRKISGVRDIERVDQK